MIVNSKAPPVPAGDLPTLIVNVVVSTIVSTPTDRPNIGSDILGYAWVVAWRSLLHVNTIHSWANSTVLFAFWILFGSAEYNLWTVVFVEGVLSKHWISKVVEVIFEICIHLL